MTPVDNPVPIIPSNHSTEMYGVVPPEADTVVDPSHE